MSPTKPPSRSPNPAAASVEQIRFALGDSSLGSVLVASSERGLCAILMGCGRAPLVADLKHRFTQAEIIVGDAGDARVVAQVVAVMESPRAALLLPLDMRGTAFQQRVWQALAAIPWGDTMTYTEVAQSIGSPKAARAVASACAANKLAVVIPCHRVLRSDGSLSGYRWGIERKRALLAREAETSL